MTINIENLDKLIAHMKKVHKNNFDMRYWISKNDSRYDKWFGRPVQHLVSEMEKGEGGCGTAACLAGHAALLKRAEEGRSFSPGLERWDAEQWLGLTEVQADELFLEASKFITIPDAIKTLEHLRETALKNEPEVIWSYDRNYYNEDSDF